MILNDSNLQDQELIYSQGEKCQHIIIIISSSIL